MSTVMLTVLGIKLKAAKELLEAISLKNSGTTIFSKSDKLDRIHSSLELAIKDLEGDALDRALSRVEERVDELIKGLV